MSTTISQGEKNSGLQAGVIHGNVGNITIVQSETLDQACLRDLHATNPVDDKERIKDTKGGLLEDSYRWILDNKEFKQWQDSEKNRLLWIRGDPGKGKTMLLCGVIEELTRLYGDNTNILFFFCQATDTRINSATSVLRGLIYLLVKNHPSLLHHVRARYDYAGKTLFEDVNAWYALSTIFRDILNDPTLQMTYLVIDALDECTNGLRFLLDLIVQESSVNPQIKWVVSSRNWLEIAERLNIATQLAPISLELNEVSVSGAVNHFIHHKVQELSKTKRYLPMGGLKSFPPGLDALYGRMIDRVRESEDAELCKDILAIISTVFRPITLHELTSFIKLPDDDYDDLVSLEEIIAICGSFLTLREHTIVFVHQSAKEFLLKDALSEILPRGIEVEHDRIFIRSLEVIFKTLQRDIWNIKLPGLHIKEICKPSPNPLAAVEYSCVYWMDHLEASLVNGAYELGVYDRGRVDTFLQQKFLHWLEALSILGSVSDGIQMIQKLEILLEDLRPDWILNDPVEKGKWSSCLQTLEGHSDRVTSIAWSQDGSQLASASFDHTVRIWDTATGQRILVLEGHSGIWDTATGQRILVLEGHSGIWDPANGQSILVLEGHSDGVGSISWSLDGSRLASASYDHTVRIWDPANGQSILVLKGHSEYVTSIAWSPDGSRLVSASADHTIRIWDPASGQSIATLTGHRGWVNSIAWTPDGSRLASASNDNTVMIWDPSTRRSLSTLEGHSGWVSSIAWSPDGSRLASASYDHTIRMWNPATGQSISTFEGHSQSINSIAWTPDGSRLASASNDKTVMIWDPATSQSLSTLEGHNGWVISVAWSPDGSQLASASDDKTVMIWDPSTRRSLLTLEGHSYQIYFIAWSPDGSRLASASYDRTVMIWDLATGQSMSNLPIGLIDSLQFDKDDLNLLHTNIGTYDIGSKGPMAPVSNDFISPLKRISPKFIRKFR
ncbi:hypothetical protein N7504_010457 [Penicillium tannophilum]|nr:hypothetical protein N7504_010457 [Penicillium tannophilum]